MNGLIPEAYAQAGAAPAGSQFAPLVMMVLFIVIFYFLLIRPQQKKAKEHQAMLGNLSVGDTFVTLEIAVGVHIKVQKFQVSSLVPKGTFKSA